MSSESIILTTLLSLCRWALEGAASLFLWFHSTLSVATVGKSGSFLAGKREMRPLFFSFLYNPYLLFTSAIMLWPEHTDRALYVDWWMLSLLHLSWDIRPRHMDVPKSKKKTKTNVSDHLEELHQILHRPASGLCCISILFSTNKRMLSHLFSHFSEMASSSWSPLVGASGCLDLVIPACRF